MSHQHTRMLPAIGGLTAAIALLTGLSSVRADELSDLRANQQLLQQRIDQLAQGQPGVGTSPLGTAPVPGAAMLGGSFPRSFLIPGTDTSIRVGGFVDITGLYFLSGGGGQLASTPSSNSGQNGALPGLPLDIHGQTIPGTGAVAVATTHSRGNGVFEFSPQQSRLSVETRTPTGYGEARTVLEFDWSGCKNFSCQSLQQGGGDSILPRLRYAYGTLGGLLAGQAISNFSDPDADTESVDFGGLMGGTGGMRIPQVRYTVVGPWGSAFSLSAEQPWTDVLTPSGVIGSEVAVVGFGTTSPTTPTFTAIPALCNAGVCNGAGGAQVSAGKPPAPNLTFASYWAQPWGHVDFAGLVRFYDVVDGKFLSNQIIGYGGAFGGDVKPGWFGWVKDDIQFHVVVGEGIGNYASGGENTFLSLATNETVATACKTPTAACVGTSAASDVIVKPITSFSGFAGYMHWWAPNLRSQIGFGIAHQDVPSRLIGPVQDAAVNKELVNALITLVWNPVPFVTTGIQYMYGHRQVVANLKGDENVISAKWRVAF